MQLCHISEDLTASNILTISLLVEVGQVVGQSWSGLVNICQNMFLVKDTWVINIQRDLC